MTNDSRPSPTKSWREAWTSSAQGLGAAEAAWLQTCVHCGLCAESCHYFLTDHEAPSIPAHKLEQVAAGFRGRFTLAGRLAPALVGARPFDRELVRAWVEAAFGRCSGCGRCSLNCTTGVNIAAVMRAARGTLTRDGPGPGRPAAGGHHRAGHRQQHGDHAGRTGWTPCSGSRKRRKSASATRPRASRWTSRARACCSP